MPNPRTRARTLPPAPIAGAAGTRAARPVRARPAPSRSPVKVPGSVLAPASAGPTPRTTSLGRRRAGRAAARTVRTRSGSAVEHVVVAERADVRIDALEGVVELRLQRVPRKVRRHGC